MESVPRNLSPNSAQHSFVGSFQSNVIRELTTLADDVRQQLLEAEVQARTAAFADPRRQAGITAAVVGVVLNLALVAMGAEPDGEVGPGAWVDLSLSPDQVIGVMAGPFYLDSGYTKADIATVKKAASR